MGTRIGLRACTTEWEIYLQQGWHRGNSVPHQDRGFLLPGIGRITMQTAAAPVTNRVSPVPTPTCAEIRDWLATNPNPPALVPIYREIMADAETPVSAFIRIANGTPGFILESVEGGERIARYSFIGADPFAMIRLRDGHAEFTVNGKTTDDTYTDPLTYLEAVLARYRSEAVPGVALPRFVGGAVGYLSYEAVRAFEPRVGSASGPGLGYPDAEYMLVDSLLVFDNVSRTIKVVAHLNLVNAPDLDTAYEAASAQIDLLVRKLREPAAPLPSGGKPVPTAVEARRKVNTDPLY